VRKEKGEKSNTKIIFKSISFIAKVRGGDIYHFIFLL